MIRLFSTISAACAASLLEGLGYTVKRCGHIIRCADRDVLVAPECSGVRVAAVTACVIIACALLRRHTLLQAALSVAVGLALALVANIVRVAFTVIVPAGHELAGYAMAVGVLSLSVWLFDRPRFRPPRAAAGLLALFLLPSVCAAAGPPPQRLARTLPPDIVALIASNAPPGAHIRYRHARATPYDPGKAYTPGVVVIASDGNAYISIGPVPAATVAEALIEPLLKDMIGQSGARKPGVADDAQLQKAVTPLPPAGYFRPINAPATNAPAKKASAILLSAATPMRNTEPIPVPLRRVKVYDDTEPRRAGAGPPLALPPRPDPEQLERAKARIKAHIAANGPRPKRQRKVYRSSFFPRYETIRDKEGA